MLRLATSGSVPLSTQRPPGMTHRIALLLALPLAASYVHPLPPTARHACSSSPSISGRPQRHPPGRAVASAVPLASAEEPEARSGVIPAVRNKGQKFGVRMWGVSSSGEQLGPHLFLFGKVLNWFGALYLAQALLWAILWSATMAISNAISAVSSWDPKRKFFDATGKLWSFWNMKVGGCAPAEVTGLEYVPPEGQPVVFAANHASWFDIPLVAQCIPSTFKFVASAGLSKLPLIGQQLTGGRHVLIDRRSRKSQLRSFKESVAWLSDGVSIMAFPEGTRSRDGKLAKKFKGGVFSMATKTGCPIVPISIVGAFSTFPPEALMPYGPKGKDLAIHFHPPIDTAGKTEEELQQLTRDAIASKLPEECR